MNFKAGDVVVCVDAVTLPGGIATDLVAGAKYHVEYTAPSCVVVREAPLIGFAICVQCRGFDAAHHYFPWRFIKLDGELETERVEDEAIA